MNILIIGFTSEGSTDVRFLESIIRRTFEAVACECEGDIQIYDVQHLPTEGNTFTDEVLRAAQKAENNGVMVLCVHADADDDIDANVQKNKIKPAFEAVAMQNERLCKNLVAIIPVRMTEAWMLADKELLKQEIGTHKSDSELGLARRAETIADPKAAIENAIRITFEDSTRRKRNRSLDISELYLPMGQKLSLEKLALLPSYVKFRNAVREAFVKLNYLH
jgi:hypothetical protein